MSTRRPKTKTEPAVVLERPIMQLEERHEDFLVRLNAYRKARNAQIRAEHKAGHVAPVEVVE
jgi:hypothetical protein